MEQQKKIWQSRDCSLIFNVESYVGWVVY